MVNVRAAFIAVIVAWLEAILATGTNGPWITRTYFFYYWGGSRLLLQSFDTRHRIVGPLQ